MANTKLYNIQAMWEEGLRSHLSGDLRHAKEIYKTILEIEPTHFDSLYLSSTIAVGDQEFSVARDFLIRALDSNPKHIEANFNLAAIFEKLGQSENALIRYALLLQISPNHIQALFNSASLSARAGRLQEALENFKRVFELDPNLTEAKKNYETLAFHLQEEEASHSHDQDNFAKLHQSGLQLVEDNKPREAIILFDKALTIFPDSPEANHNKAMALEKMGDLESALTYYQRAILHRPNSSTTLNNMGNVYRELGSIDKAIDSLESAIAIDPKYAEAFNNLGWTLYGKHQFQEAISCYQQAIELQPNLSAAKFNLGLCQLLTGDLENGWKNYEFRVDQPGFQKNTWVLNKPQWRGEPLENKSIYVYAEQGLGDTLQFCRYIGLLARRGAKVFLEIQHPLKNLLTGLEGVTQFTTADQAANQCDYYCPLMSLPLGFKTQLDNIPNELCYIPRNQNKDEVWAKKLSHFKGLKVGLVWSGGFRPNQPELWRVNARRNIPFNELKEINLDEIHFFSLQKGEVAKDDISENPQNIWSSGNFYDFTDEIVDFTDTASFIANLDLVISVDTSTAHLAGALGKPVWILNRYDNCWRWMIDRTDSPWYPTARLYRQKNPDNWANIISEVKRDLQKLI